MPARLSRLYGASLAPAQADRILASVLINHDTVPDLVGLTAELARSSRRTTSFREVRRIAKAESGLEFDAEGWIR